MAEEDGGKKIDGEKKIEGVKLLLFDIEGTVCPISYVKDTLFPYATKALPSVLAKQWDSPAFQPYRAAAPEEARASQEAYIAAVNDLTASNSKVPWLKNLQGYLWEDGYKSGAYSTPLFPDVVPALKQWGEGGLRLAIYSSGSVFAQKLLFAHVQRESWRVDGVEEADETPAEVPNRKRGRSGDEAEVSTEGPSKKRKEESVNDGDGDAANPPAVVGADKDDVGGAAATEEKPQQQTDDLTSLFEGWFDTTNAGPKTEAKSYETIAGDVKLQPEEILFFSDNVKEIEAAIQAKMQTVLVDRPGNAPLDKVETEKYRLVESFEEIGL
ncbi:hypothetical protein PRZ48_003956 [Zasmidium cellare]|uniref:Enolase-phosphatase E1 n=1 Tax=Zasmidium cellare TaxID=395010 RepID=A0ABR0EXU6_ZASCE|nr:hypothetical protein PRZ48_003956 [Zasmidium cellare]